MQMHLIIKKLRLTTNSSTKYQWTVRTFAAIKFMRMAFNCNTDLQHKVHLKTVKNEIEYLFLCSSQYPRYWLILIHSIVYALSVASFVVRSAARCDLSIKSWYCAKKQAPSMRANCVFACAQKKYSYFPKILGLQSFLISEYRLISSFIIIFRYCFFSRWIFLLWYVLIPLWLRPKSFARNEIHSWIFLGWEFFFFFLPKWNWIFSTRNSKIIRQMKEKKYKRGKNIELKMRILAICWRFVWFRVKWIFNNFFACAY